MTTREDGEGAHPTRHALELWLTRVYTSRDRDVLRSHYDAWAESYDALLQAQAYSFPSVVGALTQRYVDPRRVVMDGGCGTGLLGEQLSERGFAHVVGADFSAAMLEIARSKAVYTALVEADLETSLPFQDDQFGAATFSGVFTRGHLSPQVLAEACRVVQPEGHIIFTVTDTALVDLGFAAAIRRLEEDQRWHLVERTEPFFGLPYRSVPVAEGSRAFVFSVR